MKILLTGSTGFIGKAVYKEAIARGHKVTVFGDRIENFSEIKEEHDRLIHLAWPRDLSPDSPVQLETIAQHFNFLKKVVDCGIKDITVAGTCLEPYDSCYYAVSKKALFDALRLLPDVKLKWLRYFYVYGEGQREQSLYAQLLKAIENKDDVFRMSHGKQERDFIPLEVAARETVTLAEDDTCGVFEIGTGKPQRVIDFVTKVMRNKGHTMRLDTKAYQVPVWEPDSFAAGVRAE